jgi:hypothetical protein
VAYLVFDELYPGICLTTEVEHGKTSVSVSQYTIKKTTINNHNTKYYNPDHYQQNNTL